MQPMVAVTIKKKSKMKSEDMDEAKFNHSIALGNEGRDMYGRGEHRQAVAKLEECFALRRIGT